MLINYLAIFILGFISVAYLTAFFRRLCLKYKVLLPRSVPLAGGPAIALVFLILTAFYLSGFGKISGQMFGFLSAALMMFVFGLIDDLRDLSIIAKFLTQIIASGLLVYFNVRTHIVYLGDSLNILITIIWLVGITNALNHLDVIDGLAAGATFIMAISFTIISAINHDAQSMAVSLIMASTVSGFLIFNLPSAKVYMGNSGSHFLGFSLGALALLISYAPLERKIALLSPVAILWFPIFDTIFLTLLRIRKGKSVFKKSNDHFALRLLKYGFSKGGALGAMLFFTALFSICGVLLSQVKNSTGTLIISAIILISVVLFKKVGRILIHG